MSGVPLTRAGNGGRDPRHAVWFLYALIAVTGIVDGLYDGQQGNEPVWWTITAAAVLNYATFVWYCRDTDARGIARSRAGNIFMVLLAPLAVPIYLMRRAGAHHRLRALLRMAGFLALFFLADTVGMLAGGLLA